MRKFLETALDDTAIRPALPASMAPMPDAGLWERGGPDIAGSLRTLAEANAQFRAELGRTDHVTLLPNRTRFIEDIQASLCNGDERDQRLVMVLVTLAEAKQFNEILRALGHAYAEDFVRAGAERLHKVIDAEVAVYHVSVLSFAFLVEAPAPGERPVCISQIVEAFVEPLMCHGIPIDTRVGVGLTPLDPVVNDPAELLRATLAAAQDSRAGTDGWAWYNKKSDAAHVRAFTLLADLKPAIESGRQLFLNYQPRICMKTRRTLSVEALVRWNHPLMGLVSPGEFIPLAEATALVTPLTRCVIAMAVAKLAEWRDAGVDIKMSVNISPKNVMEFDFVDYIVATCATHGVDPHRLELEFTEGTLTTNNKTAMDRLRALHALGIEIAIDDFGSGYSNMNYLTMLPAQTIKIDQSFVRPLDSQPKNEILLRAIIGLGHDLGYKVVAEGIETEASFDKLRDWGCDEGQGFFMSRPLSDEALEAWLVDGAYGPA